MAAQRGQTFPTHNGLWAIRWRDAAACRRQRCIGDQMARPAAVGPLLLGGAVAVLNRVNHAWLTGELAA